MTPSTTNPRDCWHQFSAASRTPSRSTVAKKKSPMAFFSSSRLTAIGTSVKAGFGRMARRKALAALSCSAAPSATMHKSTSLSGRESPRACEPKRYTAFSGITPFIAFKQRARFSRCSCNDSGKLSKSNFIRENIRSLLLPGKTVWDSTLLKINPGHFPGSFPVFPGIVQRPRRCQRSVAFHRQSKGVWGGRRLSTAALSSPLKGKTSATTSLSCASFCRQPLPGFCVLTLQPFKVLTHP